MSLVEIVHMSLVEIVHINIDTWIVGRKLCLVYGTNLENWSG
jgi:hypothetical protein